MWDEYILKIQDLSLDLVQARKLDNKKHTESKRNEHV